MQQSGDTHSERVCRSGSPRRREVRADRREPPASSLQQLLAPLAEEMQRLEAQNEALQQQLAAERQTARATERRLREHLQSLLEQRNGVGAEPEPAMVLPPPTHPFWRQDDGPAQAIRMLADSESGRTRAAAQLEAALEARRALASQLESLREHCRSLQSTVLSLELRAGRL